MSTPAEPSPIGPSELEAFEAVTARAFGSQPDPAELAIDREILEFDRTLAYRSAVAGGIERIVGTAAIISFTLSVPGAELPAAGVTSVGVLPTHRRRGILTALMQRQLTDIVARREPLAVLFASETGIYGRYGYGRAAGAVALTVPRTSAGLSGPPDPGELVLGPAAEAQAELATVYDRVQADRPGYYRRGDSGWRLRLFNPPSRRNGLTELQAVVHTGPDRRPDGYALYRTKGAFSSTAPDGEVAVTEVAATDLAGYAALWRYLLNLDLMARTTAIVALDDPILQLLVNPYMAAPRLSDNLWVRIVDLPAALTGRRYAAPVDVTMEVTDPQLPANSGRWQLRAGPGSDPEGATTPSCTRTDAEPDLALGIDALAAAYLGGPSLAALAAAGQVRQLRPGALHAVTAAFGWARQPFCPQVF